MPEQPDEETRRIAYRNARAWAIEAGWEDPDAAPSGDYHDGDFTGPGLYRVWYGRAQAPAGPFPDVTAMATDQQLFEYPADGYIVSVDDQGAASNVPSLNPDDLYPAMIESIKNRYEQRIMAVLNRIRYQLRISGIRCNEVVDMSTDDYRWSFVAKPAGLEQVDITLEIAEALQYGDEREDGKPGINFGLDIVAEGGQVLGGMTPFNYSEQVWVDATDPDAVDERFRLFEEADALQALDLVLQSPAAKEAPRG